MLQSAYDKIVSPLNGDYSETTLALADAVARQGDSETNLYAHSWGTTVTRNALKILADGNYQNPELTVAAFGPAVRPGALVDPMTKIVGDKERVIGGALSYFSSPYDFVATFVGGTLLGSPCLNSNSTQHLTGAAQGEFWGAMQGIKPVFDGPVNPHSCYGLNCVGTPYSWTEQKAAEWKKMSVPQAARDQP